MSFFSRRTIAAVAIATVATFPLLGSPAEAHSTHAKKTSHSHKVHTKKFHAKFVLVGRVKAVSESGITVTVKGGNLKKALRHTDVTVDVTETTKITVKDELKTLADVVAGDRVTVKGTRARTDGAVTYTAERVHVKHAAKAEKPVATETPTPTETTIAS